MFSPSRDGLEPNSGQTWDSSLATSAQAFAETCPTNHSNADGLGENIFFSYSATDKNSLDYYVRSKSLTVVGRGVPTIWMGFTTMDDNASNIKDATQMAWAETGLIGCGVKVCGKDKSGESQFKYVVVCHYKEPGNKIGAEIYQPGDTCTACPAGMTCETDSGLCA
ncbi:Protein CBG01194 [Caenorhabditis briggsae]|uniref:Protein CBG01194 n=1 Tax=Caenorhabditis briggsae TaxID=6238 RepID=A8WPT3_CAEBR|nr:Protein CBG01194 [Caenorhabditis briggsae]CAP22490.2 Protein CBG01194 [Caenorhabditis briggsae]